MLSELVRENTGIAPPGAPDPDVDWEMVDKGFRSRPPMVVSAKSPASTFWQNDTWLATLDLPAEASPPEVESDGTRIFPVWRPIPPLERARLEQLDVSSKLEVLQSWEGVVTDVDTATGEFTARLHDLGDRDEEREAVFDLREVSANDRDLLRPGGVFQWMIGYRRFTFGSMERVSSITFRRLPAWYAEDLDAARSEGEALAAAFTAD